ncbi:DUF1127 domain-containing protein [Phyllobacterium myrsinacearum]|uniref:Uncharacterized protein YjiS (DUF1127 family) n=1 Tax=Phyllobacterium myrsinacearum TaxID=28101 RepID=A0A839EE05_9HYPH|nr:hypothetical protein [Phyllobacterium myrsinacearum]MBA8878171.1 uncharacterized protein YjiS (DUF1127 family) [Phyllobacterium myrsinacearum]
MNTVDFGIVNTIRRLWTEFAHTREEMRTERSINGLPEYLLKDIGWPDAYAERLARRNSLKEVDAGNDNASTIRQPNRLQHPAPKQGGKASQSGYFKLEY